jgi:hypothetical protein
MTAEQLQRARKLFETVSDEDAAVRAALLKRECEGDPGLLALVEQMIEADARVQPVLDQPQGLAGDSGPDDAGTLQAGDRVGPYRIVREIGAGGMGAVYQAERASDPGGGFVAVKVVRWFSSELSRRFQQEQAILSGLQHPNIARLLDSGTTGNRSPYFVMEYVEGTPIDSYCEEKGVSIEGRIRLFRQVCAAVAYSHQHLVVHRDLKPGNILVTADGTAMLLDFGIAKLMDPVAPGLATQTLTRLRAYTPQYASPEQIRGGATSTLSDVYSLGVLLYELLTGELPFSAPVDQVVHQVHEALRRICEEEPPKPSLAGRGRKERRRDLTGELDNIVLKALRKEPERRYASVEQFDEDLRRYLDQEPVLAQTDSIGYRARKFAARHKGGVAAGLTMVLLLSGGVVATSIEAGIAREERARAELQAREAESQRRVAEQQRAEANVQRALAEQRAREADRERANAERRLAELQKLAKGVVRLYDANGGSAQDASALIAENVRDSLLVLRQERSLEPGLEDVLDRIEAAGPSSEMVNDPSWEVPEGWTANETKLHEYRVGRDSGVVHSGKSSLFLKSLVARPTGSVKVVQSFIAKPYLGKRVRLTAFVKSEAVVRRAALDLVASFDAATAKVAGTTSWKKYEVVVNVPAASDTIRIMLMLEGAGALWADDFTFEQVGSSVPITIKRPENLSFTEPQQ